MPKKLISLVASVCFVGVALSLRTSDGKPVLKGEKPIPFEREALVKLLTDGDDASSKIFKSIIIASRASGANGKPSRRTTQPAQEAKPQFGLR